ncbi:hypothetical protein TNCV_2112491 [Trichonephila clavipes]|nr:hypothetical protein TNCV_2112491 [Trichonephila clavipes]
MAIFSNQPEKKTWLCRLGIVYIGALVFAWSSRSARGILGEESKSSMSRSNSASEVDFQVDPRPKDYPLAGSRWIEEYIDNIRTVAVHRRNSGRVDDEERIPSAHRVSQTTYRPPPGRSDMVVARCWQQWITEGRVYRRGGSGRPRNTNDREDRAIRRVAISAPTTSLASIQRHLPPSRHQCHQEKP